MYLLYNGFWNDKLKEGLVMNYNSTRNNTTVVSASQAIAQGISKEGGLFVPQSLPTYSLDDISVLSKLDYKNKAKNLFFFKNAFQEVVKPRGTHHLP